MAKIVDLIAKCDESEMMTQNLQANIVEMKIIKNNGQITFLTSPEIVLNEMKGKSEKIGIVIWFPADVFER